MDNYELRIKDIIDKYYPLIYTNENIVGIGLGNKTIGGNVLDIPCLSIHVRNKVSKDSLDRQNIIPKMLCGVLTDVVDIGVREDDSLFNLRSNTLSNDEIEKPARGGHLITNSSPNSRIGTLGVAVTEITPTGIAKTQNNVFMLSTARVLTGNFKSIGLGDEIMQRSGVGVVYTQQKLGNLSKVSNVEITKKGSKVSVNKNFTDAAIGFVERIADPSDPSDPTNKKVRSTFKLDSGLFNGCSVKVDQSYINSLDNNTPIVVMSKYSGILPGKIESKYYSGSYAVGDNDAYFFEQMSMDIPIQYWDYGALVFRPSSDHKSKVLYAVGQIIGHVGDEKSRKVIFTPIDKVLKAMEKQIFQINP